jgi:hypothetical protein
MTRVTTVLATALCAALFASSAAAQEARTLCVYDPSGANGDVFAMAKEYRNAAAAWGATLNLKPYVDEKTAAEDFKAGKCNAAVMTGVRTRAFNKFSSTLEAMGGLQSYDQLRQVVTNLAGAKASGLMKRGDYETVALLPAGAVYLYVRDRNIKSIGDLAGKRIATLDFDVAAKVMVQQVGASMVVADIGTFASMFNNGGVDACYAPATAYQPLELKKGLGAAGGVIRYPLSELTMQIVLRAGDFPAGYGQKSREWAAKEFKRFLKIVEKGDKSIPAKYWVDVPKPDQAKYDLLFRDVRIRLRDQEKVFDGQALKLLRRIRCKTDGTRAECAEQKE